MSLLSYDRAQVIDAQNLVSNGFSLLSAQATTGLTLQSGLFKQAVGYMVPRNEELTFVLDINTNEPLRLPQGYVPLQLYTVPLQQYTNSPLLCFQVVNDNNNTFDFGTCSGWDKTQLNTWTLDEIDDAATGLTYLGFNRIAIKNLNYPTPVSNGISKVVLEYF
jgi:hypothetical protein